MPIGWAQHPVWNSFNPSPAYGDILRYVQRYGRLDAIGSDLVLSDFQNLEHDAPNRHDPEKREGSLARASARTRERQRRLIQAARAARPPKPPKAPKPLKLPRNKLSSVELAAVRKQLNAGRPIYEVVDTLNVYLREQGRRPITRQEIRARL